MDATPSFGVITIPEVPSNPQLTLAVKSIQINRTAEILEKNKYMSLDFPNGFNQMIRRAVLYIIELEQCEGLKLAGCLRAAI